MAISTSSAAAPMPATTAGYQPTFADFGWVTAALVAHGAFLYVLVGHFADAPARPLQMVGPLLALTAWIAAVWLVMLVVRNYATLRDLSLGAYYRTFEPSAAPAEWIERPARTFNNLMQAPWLFYAVCSLMLITERLDGAQLALAWAFVAARAAHALVYASVNFLPARFGCWAASMTTLWVLWWRFGASVWHGL